MGIFCSKGDVEHMVQNVKQSQTLAALVSIDTEPPGEATRKIQGNARPTKDQKKMKTNVVETISRKLKVTAKSDKNVDPVSSELRAAILIQKWFRLWIGKLKARRQIAWRIFQKVEYYGERNQMRLNRFFRILIDEFQCNTSQSKLVLLDNRQIKSHTSNLEGELQDIPPDVEVNISPPFTVKNLNMLMRFLKMGNNLHYTCVINLLIMAADKMRTKSNINEVSTSITKKITICGDLHGSLVDLLTIFFKNDIPSVSNPYVFNGDMVDRGPNSVGVLMILCYCFLLFPNHVHLNRGNHEDHSLNKKYGLITEIRTKYQQNDKQVFNAIKSLFRYLPLGTIIDRKIFVVHGGISDTTDLSIIGDIQRDNLVSVIRPPRRVAEDDEVNWNQAIDILWSDPVNDTGCEDNIVRGGGKYFGPDVTEKFLRENKFELLIRSHECKSDGYEYDHSGKVLTIFSASNYYHPGSNKGAYIVYTGDVKKIRNVQYVSSDESLKNINFKENIQSMEENAIIELKKTLFMQRIDILKKFEEIDVNNTGKVTMENYGKVLSEVLGMNLPWRLIQPKISKKDEDNLIIYESSFEFTKQTERIQVESASAILYSNLEVLETIFRAIDKDNSGCITMDEFNDAMAILIEHSDLKTDDIEDLGEMIDADNDGYIDIDEFFDAFKVSLT